MEGLTRRHQGCRWHVVLAVLACWMGLTPASSWASEPPKTNVVLFMVDDMGWMDSTPYGSTYYETPNMMRLAGQSMRFTNAYALPLCSPTRASILTGQYSSRHGITSATGHLPPQPEDFEYLPAVAPPNQPLRLPVSKNYLDPSHYTLAEALRDAGYRTAHFGKWHLGLTEPYQPQRHGFDIAWHCAPDPGPPSYFSPYGVHSDGPPSGQHRVGNITDGPPGEHITDRLTDEAIRFINDHRETPFFLNLWLYSVHGPWQHKEAYTAEFAEKSDPRGQQGNPVMASMLQSVDESLGRILEAIDELGLAEQTLFIFYSDNGGNTHSWHADDPRLRNVTEKHPLYATIQSYRKWAGDQPPTNNAPLREGKGRIYEGGQRVPLMVRWPGRVSAGSVSDAVVGPIDLYPTILDALGLPLSEEQTIDGESLLPVLTGTGTLRRKAYFTWFPHLVPAVSVRQDHWKLIRRFQPHRDDPELFELYNLRDDLGETTNLAAKLPEKVRELDGLIDHFVEATGALYPQANPNYNPQAVGRIPVRDPMAGLVPRNCTLTLVDNALEVHAEGNAPFIGIGQVRHDGPVTMKLRARSATGGAGKVTWKTVEQEAFPAQGQSVSFEVAVDKDWQDLEVQVPVKGVTGIIRLYLPIQDSEIAIESIEFRGGASDQRIRAWDFRE